jgi:hypothetical protein
VCLHLFNFSSISVSAIMTRPYITNIWWCVFVASLGSFLNGLDNGSITSTLEHPQFFEYFFGTSGDSRPGIEGELRHSFRN